MTQSHNLSCGTRLPCLCRDLDFAPKMWATYNDTAGLILLSVHPVEQASQTVARWRLG